MRLRSRLFAALICSSIIGGQCVLPANCFSQETSQVKQKDKKDPFKVPQTDDQVELRKFLEDYLNTEQSINSPQDALNYLVKTNAIIDELLTKKIDNSFRAELSSVQFTFLMFRVSQGDAKAKTQVDSLITTLKSSDAPELKTLALRFESQLSVDNFNSLRKTDQVAFIANKISEIQRGGAAESIQLHAAVLSAVFESYMQQYDELDREQEVLAVFKELNDRSFDDFVKTLERKMSRTQLIGHKMELVSQKIDGEEFNLKNLEGQVVLVDFWASWCGPCLAEIPNLKRLYTKYHDQGFEIVGVNLDESRSDLDAYLAKNKTPWITLHEENGWSSAAVQRYGINAIPQMILIGKDGNVVSIRARGPELERELAKIFASSKAQQD